MLKSCFIEGTPLLTPNGSKTIEQFQIGDMVLSRSESDPEGVVEAKRVQELFETISPILNVVVRGRTIGTTAEHPFYVEAKGWTSAAELEPGDVLLSTDGQRMLVEEVKDTGEVATVYNLRVADHATYFVGSDEWGWNVWSHNLCGPRGKPVSSHVEKHHAIPWNNNTYKHGEHALVNQAEIDIKTYEKNLKAAQGHRSRHSPDYHKEIKRRMTEAFEKVEGKGQAAAQKELDSVIESIWADIKNGNMAPYKNKDVVLIP